MIVISTNNGAQWLPALIKSLEIYGPTEEEYLVVDTQSSDQEYWEWVQKLPTQTSLKVKVTQTPYAGRDTGAIVWAYRNFPADEYMFLHDTLIVKEVGWLDKFREVMPELGVVAWKYFDYEWYNDQATADFVMNAIGYNDNHKIGIFGPIMYTNRKTLDLFESKKLLEAIPTCKAEMQAMELGWVAICYAAKVPLLALYKHNHDPIIDKHDNYPLFTKFFARRA